MMANNNSSSFSSSSIMDRIIFRAVQPTDIPRCFDIESRSYPEDEAASKSTLQYRQHHAAPFFRCAFLIDNGLSTSYTDISSISNSNMRSPMGTTSTSNPVSRQGRSTPMNLQATLKGRIIGFICATRCSSLNAESMKSHDATGKILAIHSVVVEEKFRNSGVASAMIQDYLSAMERLNSKNGTLKVKMDKIVLMAKKNLLAFYVRNGFKAMGVSDVVHGKEQWFELERDLPRDDDEKHKCYLLDCFADVNQEGSGNPAAVVLLNGTPGGQQGEDEPTINNSMEDELDDIMEEDGNNNNNNAPTISPRGVEWMSVVAREFNQSETAFVWPLSNNQVSLEPYSLSPQQQQSPALPTAFGIRYYSKSGVEVDLCGHATLASAAALFESSNECNGNNVTFYAKNDVLKAERAISQAPPSGAAAMISNQCNISNASRIALDFPWKDVTAIPDGGEEQKAVLNMLSTAFFGTSIKAEVESDLMAKFIQFFNPKEQSHTLFSQHILFIGTTDAKEDLFIELTEEGFNLLRDIKVYYSALSEWDGYSRGVIICCCAGNDTPPETIENGGTSRIVNRPGNHVIDFRSRFFGPKIGIDEDPVTGSAHCSLGPYFGTKLDKKVVIGKQESERGGLVECILKKEEGRVGLVGTACVTVSGMLSMPL